MRVFTAVDIEDGETLEKLEELQERLDHGFNPVEPGKMHLTLQFFRDIDRKDVEEVKQAMKGLDMDSFRLKIKGVGVFPSKSRVRVVWAGVDSEEVYSLRDQVSRHSVSEDSEHDFHPHITLLRVNNLSRKYEKKFRQKLEKFEDRSIAETRVDSVKMFESVHNGRSTEYRKLEEVKL